MDEAADHPRHRFDLDGADVQAQALETSLLRGRLHHAWLLTGPEGLGKATFAYRAARRLLGARPNAALGPLGASPDDPVSRMIAAQSHPDLLVLEPSDATVRKVIPVDEARRLPEFFAKAPALGPYRVAIIDAVDHFNTNGANAVLKTLEEPSGRGVLFLISHAPGRLLPTVRSRCRTLAFRRWTDEAVSAFVQRKAGADAAEADRIAAMADGSPGRAMALIHAKAEPFDQVAADLVAGAPPVAASALTSLADSFRGGEGAARFALFLNRLCRAVQQRAGQSGGASAARWAELWDRLTILPGRVDGLNLDRADAFWSVISDVSSLARDRC